ncbi:MAG: phosphotransferase family protein [Gammaproteobacteria bacterium]
MSGIDQAGGPVQGLDEDALTRYLDDHGLGDGAIVEVKRIGEGHSNLTFLVRREAGEFVVRRPPPPPIPQGVHDVMREARVLGALRGRVPVAEVYAACADESVLGVPFYVMQYFEGWVLTNTLPAAFEPAAERTRVSEALVDALARLHAIDPDEVGLGDFGRPEGFVARQLERHTRRWQEIKTRDIDAFDRTTRWLADELPPARPGRILHGDYRLGNVMYAPRAPAELRAMFDWELSTLGDPLVDLGYLLAFWVEPADPPLKFFEMNDVTRLGGFYTREQVFERYLAQIGADVDSVRWYEVFALWRLTAMMQSIYRLAAEGRVENDYLAGFESGVTELAERAYALTAL